MKQPAPTHCSFCGQPPAGERRLVAGPGVSICSACVQLCTQILTNDPPRSGPAPGPDARPRPRKSWWRRWWPGQHRIHYRGV